MSLRYLSVCSGVEAASLAWKPLGWSPVAFSEIAPFPSAVLAHRFGSNLPGEPLATNGLPNLGDMTKFREWPDLAIDLLVGGTPCQSFSLAGLRAGLADPRGNLALVYLAILERYRPKWFLWENVPGVLSSNGGRDFGAFLGGVVQLGYGFAYRVLDAQYVRVDGFGQAVPQRRRRVFVVGHSGADWRRAGAVLFDAASLRGDSAPRREARKGAASIVSGGPDGGRVADVASTLNAAFGSKLGLDNQHIGQGAPMFVAHALRGAGFDASEDGTGRGMPLVPVCFSSKDHGADAAMEFAPTLRSMGHAQSHANGGGQLAVAFPARMSGTQHASSQNVAPSLCAINPTAVAVAFDLRGREGGAQFEGPHDAANIRAASGGSSRSYVAYRWAVRRLMPLECERLQGMPNGWTDVPYRGKPAADGPRYHAIGNSMAVNVMRWIGLRIRMVEALR